jgi:hypothetical protein
MARPGNTWPTPFMTKAANQPVQGQLTPRDEDRGDALHLGGGHSACFQGDYPVDDAP